MVNCASIPVYRRLLEKYEEAIKLDSTQDFCTIYKLVQEGATLGGKLSHMDQPLTEAIIATIKTETQYDFSVAYLKTTTLHHFSQQPTLSTSPGAFYNHPHHQRKRSREEVSSQLYQKNKMK